MKNKHFIAVFLIGLAVTTFGALLKIMHFEFGAIDGNVLLTIGLTVQAISIIGLVVKILSDKNSDSFLNK